MRRNKILKILSWNVNGLRAVLGKGFLDFLGEEQPDIMGIQENSEQPEVTVITPAYNEEKNLPLLYELLMGELTHN